MPEPTKNTSAIIPVPPTEAEAIANDRAVADALPFPFEQTMMGVWAARKRQILLIAALFVATYATTWWFLFLRWTFDPAATHGWLVLPIVSVVVWYKKEKLRRLPLIGNPAGLWVMGLALFLHLAERAIDLNGPSPLSIPIFVTGAVWYFAGTAWLRELAFPLGYLLFMIPVPGGFTEIVSFPLRMLATGGSRTIAGYFGVNIHGSGMHMEFMQPSGDEYIRLEVADPCSGLHSIMAIKALHAITAYLTRLKLGWKWVLFMCAIPVALAANLCRMVSIILIGAYVNKNFALGLWHENIAPYLLFGFAFLILITLGRFMEWATGATKHERAPDDAANYLPRKNAARKPSYSVVIGMLAVSTVLSIFFGTRGENISAVADVTAIPRDLGSWKYRGDIQLDDSAMKQILADSYVDRIYENPQGQQIELLVVYRRYGRREFAHRPELCYPAGGFTIVKKDRTTLPYAGRDCRAVYLLADGTNVARRDGGSGVPTTTVSYLFASGQRTESDFMLQQIWMAFERVIPNKNGWTFVRLSAPRTTNDADSLAAEQDFMRVYAPSIEKIITTDGSPSPQAQTAPLAAANR